MASTDDHLRKLIEEENAKHRELASALENGGLPSEQEAQEAWKMLNVPFDEIEGLVWRIKLIAETGELAADELPFEITLEHIGVLTMLASDINDRADDFHGFAEEIRSHIDSLLVTRTSQSFQAEQKTSNA